MVIMRGFVFAALPGGGLLGSQPTIFRCDVSQHVNPPERSGLNAFFSLPPTELKGEGSYGSQNLTVT